MVIPAFLLKIPAIKLFLDKNKIYNNGERAVFSRVAELSELLAILEKQGRIPEKFDPGTRFLKKIVSYKSFFLFSPGSRSHTPCSPPDQNFDKKNQTLSQSSISLPAIKGGGVGGGTGGVSEQMGSSSHHHHHNHHDIDHDCISLRHDSIRQSKASDVDVVTDLAADEKSITWGFVGGGGGLSGGGTMMREGTADVQPVLTWGFQLWECFSDTKWCIITGFFPCITEFILRFQSLLTNLEQNVFLVLL